MDIYHILIITHIIGTALGVGSATFAEIHYLRFNRDNIITDDEKKTLTITYTVMRTGLFLLVVSGFGMLLYFRLTEYVELLTHPTFWAKMSVVAILVTNALLLQARLMPFLIGTAISITSWYTALVLGVVGQLSASYTETMLYYVVAIALFGLGLQYLHSRLHGN